MEMIFNIYPVPEQDCIIPPIDLVPYAALQPLTISLTFNGSWHSEFNNPDQIVLHWKIEQEDLPNGEPYEITTPIPVVVNRESDIEFEANIGEANLAGTGATRNEAFTNLVCVTLDAFDYFDTHQDELGPGPMAQWNFLRAHIAKTHNGSR